jgi:hypothetical protein
VTPRAAGPAALGPAAAAPPAPQAPARFAVDTLPRQAWEVRGAAAEPPTLAGFGEQAVRLRSGPPGHPAAVAALQEYAWADSGTIRLRLGFSNRLNLRFGPVVISHDSGWRLDGPVDGWTTGRFCPLPVEPDKAHDLTIAVRRGEVCVAVDGKPLLERVRFRLPATGNRLELSTWAGDWLIVEGVEVCSEAPEDLSAPTHPILPQTTQALHRDQH